MKDWTGNAQTIHSTNGRREDAAENDYYATEPKEVELLLENEEFSEAILEPACGEGHISKVLEEHGYHVVSMDLVQRGFGLGGIDFLCRKEPFNGDIITNPPYKFAKQFVEKALEIVPAGGKVAMFLKLTFLEGQGRRDLFRNNPPETVYVSSSRLECGKNGQFTKTSAVAYCWVVWKKGHSGPTELKWIN